MPTAYQPQLQSQPQPQRFAHTPAQLQELAAAALDQAKKLGASACEVDVSEGFGQSVSVRCGEVETLEHNRDKGLGVTVYLGKKRGNASTSDFSTAAINETVAAALAIARFTADDDCAGLAEPELLARDIPDLDLYHPWELSPDAAIELARRAEDAAFAVSRQISNSEGASVSTQEAQFVSANSHGFMAGYPSSRHYLACSMIAGEGERMQRDDWYVTTRQGAALADPESIGRRAAERAVAKLGARKIDTMSVPVLFEAPLAAGLIGSFVRAASGGSLYRKASFLLDSLNQPVFSPQVAISERPHLKAGLASSAFDSDGVATYDREVVADGRLLGYFLNVYTARKLGLATTANAGGSHNLIVRPGSDDFAALLRRMGRGLLVTELLGQGINYVTGDYSRGAAGYWVENGVIAYPVEEITIAGNLRQMFAGIVAVGSDVICRGAYQVGSLLIDEMKVAGA